VQLAISAGGLASNRLAAMSASGENAAGKPAGPKG